MKRQRNAKGAMLLLGATMVSMSAWAAPPAEIMVTKTETVKFSRGLAETPTGAVQLYGELRAAAARACRDAGTRPSMMGEAYLACVDGAMAKAVGDVNIAAVSAIYLQTGKSLDKKGIVTVAKR